VVQLAKKLGLRYLVLTSPNRDELSDGGASQFAKIIVALRTFNPALRIEILVPDFMGREKSFETLLQNPPDVLAHDLQTVPRLYGQIRPGARYERSLGLFRWFKACAGARASTRAASSPLTLKAGLMVGFGETEPEVAQVLSDAANSGVKLFTIGQYLKPPGAALEPKEYVPLDRYERFRKWGEGLGLIVQASPLTRSSYLADRLALSGSTGLTVEGPASISD
jgi:lipoic acid synthetase